MKTLLFALALTPVLALAQLPAPVPSLTLEQLPRPTMPPQAPPAIVSYVKLLAPEYQLSPALVLAVMAQESNFEPLAESHKKA